MFERVPYYAGAFNKKEKMPRRGAKEWPTSYLAKF